MRGTAAAPQAGRVFLTVDEVAAYLRCQPNTARRLLRRGDLPAAKVAGKWLVDEVDLVAYVEGRRTVEPTPAPARRRRYRRR